MKASKCSYHQHGGAATATKTGEDLADKPRHCEKVALSAVNRVAHKTVKTLTKGARQMVIWDDVTRSHVLRAIQDYDRLGPEAFFSKHGFAPTTTYDLVWDERPYPPKAILGTAYEFATGERLASRDFEGGKSGAVTVLGRLGFTVQARRPAR